MSRFTVTDRAVRVLLEPIVARAIGLYQPAWGRHPGAEQTLLDAPHERLSGTNYVP